MVRPNIYSAVTLTLNLWQQSPHFSSWERDLQSHLPILIHRMVRSHIHFAVTLTLNLWQWFPRGNETFSQSLTNFELGGFSTSYVIATSEQADSQVSSTFELSGVLNRLCHCDLWTSRQLSLNLEPCWHLQKTGLDTCWHLQKTSITYLELGGFSTSYVIATSELADSQVSFELGGFSTSYVIATSELADSQVSISILADIYKRQVSPFSAPQRANLEIGNASIGYVIATSEPTDKPCLIIQTNKDDVLKREHDWKFNRSQDKRKISIKEGIHEGAYTMAYKRTV